MILIALLLAAQASDDVVFVTAMNVRAEYLNVEDVPKARSFAYCLSKVRFPTEEEYAARVRKCDRQFAGVKSDGLAKVVAHLRQIVRDNPGSEASLTVAEETNAPNK